MSSESYPGYPECVVSCHGAGRLTNSIRRLLDRGRAPLLVSLAWWCAVGCGGSYYASAAPHTITRDTRTYGGPVLWLPALCGWLRPPPSIAHVRLEETHTRGEQRARSWALCGHLVPSSGADTGARCR